MTAAPQLEVANMAVHFSGLWAIADMNLRVPEGRILSLIGPNGAGKTTAFNVITVFLKPTAGKVLYRGRDLTRLAADRIAGLGVVRTFQRTSIFGGCTVFENVLIGSHLRGRTETWGALLGLARMDAEEGALAGHARELLAFVWPRLRAGEIAQPEVQWIIYGVAMIVIVFFLPQGIVPALASWWTARRRSFGAKPGAETRTP